MEGPDGFQSQAPRLPRSCRLSRIAPRRSTQTGSSRSSGGCSGSQSLRRSSTPRTLCSCGSRAPRRRFDRDAKSYTPDEVRTLWSATENLPAPLRAIYRLGLLTGQRPGEISGLASDEIDGAWWTIPGARAKTAARIASTSRSPRWMNWRVCYGSTTSRARLWAIAVSANSQSTTQSCSPARRREKPRHALRDTVATNLAALAVAVEDIAKVLNHTYGPRVTAGYNAYGYDKKGGWRSRSGRGGSPRSSKGRTRPRWLPIEKGT